VELQHVQQELQEQRGGLHTLQQKSLDLQQQTDKERSSLQEQCRNLEARRTHAQR